MHVQSFFDNRSRAHCAQLTSEWASEIQEQNRCREREGKGEKCVVHKNEDSSK